MKIISPNKHNQIMFARVPFGDVLASGSGHFYIKLLLDMYTHGTNAKNAIDLGSGKAVRFSDETLVTYYPNAVLHINT